MPDVSLSHVPTDPGGTAAKGAGPELRQGSTVGRYVVLDRVGEGGMGVVYSAHDAVLDRNIALKLLHAGPDDAPTAGRQGGLLREAQAMARLAHPNVVAIYDVGTFQGRVFVAMELVPGKSLKAWLAAGKRSWREVLRVCLEAGRGLAAAHAARLVHRDVKPGNILIGDDGRVRVTDFGLVCTFSDTTDAAAAPPAEEDAPRQAPATATLTGGMVGSPGYMAPEQYLGRQVTPATDQFSFCVTLYEALYGERPFAGDTADELTRAAVAGVIRPTPCASDVPKRVRAAVLKGLAPDPADRHATLDHLLTRLAHDPMRARNRRWAQAAAFVIAAVAATAVVVGARQRASSCSGGSAKMAGVWNQGR